MAVFVVMGATACVVEFELPNRADASTEGRDEVSPIRGV